MPATLFLPVTDKNQPPGIPAGSYVVDFATAIDGDEQMQSESEAYRAGYRDACRRSMVIMNAFARHVINSRNPLLKAYTIASALGLAVAAGKSDHEIAILCGKNSRACISKGRLEFQSEMGIKPVPGQKSKAARNTYRQARVRALNRKHHS